MGRRSRLWSPVITAKEFSIPDIRPVIKRAVVPELPASSGPSGSLNPFPLLMVIPLFSLATRQPVLARHFNVEWQSAPLEKFSTFIPSEEREPRNAARCEIDLSPGRIISPFILSIECMFSLIACLHTPAIIKPCCQQERLLFFFHLLPHWPEPEQGGKDVS